jgi:hypothetical protein
MRPGRQTLPRLRLNPQFVAAVRASRLPYEPLALACGCREAHFSYLINAVAVPSTTLNVDVLRRAADAVKFPRTDVFVDDARVLGPNVTTGASR